MAFFCLHCRSEIDPRYKACPFCGEAITDFLRNHLEAPIDGKYQILARLGVGGMGEVYKVLHLHLNAIRVIKLMRATIADDPAAHERFLREARMATRINQPNVATLFDFSTLPDGSRYMVWEHIEGTDLHELIEARGPLSPRDTARIAIEALHGLEAIHRAGIIHRDVSPENIMISRDDDGSERVKIIDLGIAKQWGDESDRGTKSGMFVGKWKYCSPEQLGMLPAGERIDRRADLYSFGIVLYEMLTGTPPFVADTPHAYFSMHASERPKPLREANPTVTASPELEAVVFRAMEKDRAQRFESARELAQALEALMPSLADTPGAPLSPPRPLATTTVAATRDRHPARRAIDEVELVSDPIEEATPPIGRRGVWLAALLILVIATIGATAMLRQQREPKPVAVAAARPTVPKPLAAPPVPTLPPAHLGINAFPWARVTSVRSLADGKHLTIGELVTPLQIELAPGRYELTLVNPDFPAPVVRSIELLPGSDQTIHVPFADPAAATLPPFGAAP
ncbi:MAG: Serine/threonine protein kinase [Acidobacteria bacterium]|nr:Serine/threonine protein kinase [Acidobacteriota bacterium]